MKIDIDYEETYKYMIKRLYDKTKLYIDEYDTMEKLTDRQIGLIDGLYIMLDTCANQHEINEIEYEQKIKLDVNVRKLVDHIDQKYLTQ